ncbi:MAG: DUF2029 domain-containing protein [Alphaproteobacteria bacterium]|nr:DUF2029 domain-containing protein [Alphaproteobacteria bacterium]
MSSEHWLRRPVVVGLSALLVALYALAWGSRTYELWRGGWLDANHMPFGGDFVTFWSASRMALDGHAIEAFDPPTFYAVQAEALPGNEARFLWNYPPTFHLLVLPFATVDLVTATWLWWAVTIPLYLAVITAIVRRPEAPLVALAGSAALLNLAHGQNGFLLTAVMAGGLWLVIRDRPVWGGLLLGCLAVKPHFGVLLPVAFFARLNPRAFFATAVSLVAWIAASTAVFGVEYWRRFVANLDTVQAAIDGGQLPYAKLVTPYVAMKTAGLDALAWPVQTVCSIGAACAVFLAVRRGRPAAAMAVVIVGTTLCSPYFYDYDLVLLSGGAAFVFVDRQEHGWLPGERELWGLAALIPVVIVPLQHATGLQLGPVLTLALLAMTTAGALRR